MTQNINFNGQSYNFYRLNANNNFNSASSTNSIWANQNNFTSFAPQNSFNFGFNGFQMFSGMQVLFNLFNALMRNNNFVGQPQQPVVQPQVQANVQPKSVAQPQQPVVQPQVQAIKVQQSQQLEAKVSSKSKTSNKKTSLKVNSTPLISKTVAATTAQPVQVQITSGNTYIDPKTAITSEKGLAVLKQFDHVHLTSYKDTGKYYSIGYGHNGPSVKPGDTITLEEAEITLRKDMEKFSRHVAKSVKVPLTQNQFDALTVFAHNVGNGAFSKSTLLKKLNAGDYQGAANELDKWIYAGGKPLKGLAKRRAAEKALFLS